MVDLNNAESMNGELLPDGSFVKVRMTPAPAVLMVQPTSTRAYSRRQGSRQRRAVA